MPYLMRCPACAKDVSTDAKRCPRCGRNIESYLKTKQANAPHEAKNIKIRQESMFNHFYNNNCNFNFCSNFHILYD